jgi:hypothetical protein
MFNRKFRKLLEQLFSSASLMTLLTSDPLEMPLFSSCNQHLVSQGRLSSVGLQETSYYVCQIRSEFSSLDVTRG